MRIILHLVEAFVFFWIKVVIGVAILVAIFAAVILVADVASLILENPTIISRFFS